MAFAVEARRAQMFPAFTREQLARVATFGVEKTFADREIVYDRGAYDPPFYVVLEGELEIVHPRDGREELVTVHHRGSFTGEVHLLAGRRTLVRARAKGAVRAIAVEPARFRSILQTDSELSDIIVRAFLLR